MEHLTQPSSIASLSDDDLAQLLLFRNAGMNIEEFVRVSYFTFREAAAFLSQSFIQAALAELTHFRDLALSELANSGRLIALKTLLTTIHSAQEPKDRARAANQFLRFSAQPRSKTPAATPSPASPASPASSTSSTTTSLNTPSALPTTPSSTPPALQAQPATKTGLQPRSPTLPPRSTESTDFELPARAHNSPGAASQSQRNTTASPPHIINI